jgi:glycine/D-amino acid oxidase-like deaminating enzyme
MFKYDLIVIGGGFFGTAVALDAAKSGSKVLLLEKERTLLSRASYNNQARIHGGYHYPRSILTGLRSRVNIAQFANQYPEAIEKNFQQYYGVAKNFSKVTAYQFETFCRRIGAPLKQAKMEVKDLFDRRYVENIYEVEEYAFNAKILARSIGRELSPLVTVKTSCEVSKVQKKGSGIEVVSTGGNFYAQRVYNCTYSQINHINARSGIPIIPLKYELTELCLFTPPRSLSKIGVTVMCGPFFSIMPFPSLKGVYSLSHVRYTPHLSWQDQTTSEIIEYDVKNQLPKTAFREMIADASRYLPILKEAHYLSSLWEIKTVLPQSESDDSRPILVRSFKELPGYLVILGGKIDNIFDAMQELKEIVNV